MDQGCVPSTRGLLSALRPGLLPCGHCALAGGQRGQGGIQSPASGQEQLRELGLGQKQKEGRMGGQCHGGCGGNHRWPRAGLEPRTRVPGACRAQLEAQPLGMGGAGGLTPSPEAPTLRVQWGGAAGSSRASRASGGLRGRHPSARARPSRARAAGILGTAAQGSLALLGSSQPSRNPLRGGGREECGGASEPRPSPHLRGPLGGWGLRGAWRCGERAQGTLCRGLGTLGVSGPGGWTPTSQPPSPPAASRA